MSVPGCAKRACELISTMGEYGGKVTSKIKTIIDSTDRTMYFGAFLIGLSELSVPKATLAGRVATARFTAYLDDLLLIGYVQKLIETPLSDFITPKKCVSAFKTASAVVAGTCSVLALADQANVISLGKIASKIGHVSVFGVSPFKVVTHLKLGTVSHVAVLAVHVLSLCNDLFVNRPDNYGTKQFYIKSAYHAAAIATRITLLAGSTLFPAHYAVASIALSTLTAGLGFAKTYSYN